GLDPQTSAVVAVALTTEAGDEVFTGPEAALLTRLDERLLELAPGVIVTWNGATFDLPFLDARAIRLGVALHLRLTEDPRMAPSDRRGPLRHVYRATWGPHRHLDGYRLYRADVGRTLGFPCGLKPMARLVGLQPVEVDRAQIHQLSAAELHDYVASDARLARELVLRRMPAAAQFADAP
ncbi:MAG: 3'-5' exonuclease, partial [Actinomycetes bacterium]